MKVLIIKRVSSAFSKTDTRLYFLVKMIYFDCIIDYICIQCINRQIVKSYPYQRTIASVFGSIAKLSFRADFGSNYKNIKHTLKAKSMLLDSYSGALWE